MNNLILINGNSVEFKNKDGQIYVSTRDIAKVFGKEHSKILRTIESLPNDDFRQANFGLSKYTKDLQDGSGVHSYKEYLLTRDGFSMLVMGFTGTKAYQWKKDFINAFNQMEQALRNNKSDSKDAITIGDAAKVLNMGVGRNRSEKVNVEISVDIETACWSFIPPHRIVVGDEKHNSKSSENYIHSLLWHELSHAKWTERDFKKINIELNKSGLYRG